jgi:type IV secretion system protein VirB10
MASRTPPLDPRIASAPEPGDPDAEAGVRPIVALPRSGLSGPALIAIMIGAAIILFLFLDSRRRSTEQPAVAVRGSEAAGATGAPPPPLYIPPVAAPPAAVLVPEPAEPASLMPRQPVPVPVPQYFPQPVPSMGPPQEPMRQYPLPSPLPAPPQRQAGNGPTLVIDNTTANPAGVTTADGQPGANDGLGTTRGVGRVRSGVFANRSTTIAQGTLIAAVLETAFDSRRPGFARAIVSRDVRGFDGSQVLIPRGSRLTGEYKSDIEAGQKRALINWTRLIRPDGVTIAIGSPAADTLGRGGVRGDYNSHFFENFAGAILQSALNVGVNLASRAADGNNVIIGLPGSTQTVSPIQQSSRTVATLKVPAGTSISIFVARDLDFSPAGPRP